MVETVTDDVAQAGPLPTDPGAMPCDRRRLLVVDDEESIRLLFHMILAYDFPDVDIDMAANGQEALDLFINRHHAVLLMDLHMPVMDGRAAFDAIRKMCDRRRWQMPAFVFCTGFAPPDAVIDAVEADASPHCLLSKPVNNETLVESVRTRLT